MGGGWKNQYSKYKEFFLSAYQTYQKKEEIKIFLEVIMSLFTISFFIFFALKPTILTILQLVETIQAKEKVVEQMDEKIENLQTAKAVFAAEANRVQLALNAVPDTPSPASFSRQMEALSGTRGVALGGVSIEPIALVGENIHATKAELENLPENASGMSFAITMSAANYSSLPILLNDLENLRRPIKVDSLTISSLAGEGGSQNLILALEGRTPYLDNEEEVLAEEGEQ